MNMLYPNLSYIEVFVYLFDLILYVPSTIFQLYRDGSWFVTFPLVSWVRCGT